MILTLKDIEDGALSSANYEYTIELCAGKIEKEITFIPYSKTMKVYSKGKCVYNGFSKTEALRIYNDIK